MTATPLVSNHLASASWRHLGWWLVGFALLSAPILFSLGKSNLSSDESAFYLPAIAQIRSHWPRVDLVNDSLSATGPGYSYALATLSFLTGSSTCALRGANWLVSFGVLALLWRVLYERGGASLTLALASLALSNFFVKSAICVVTDNAALLLTTLALVSLLFSSKSSSFRVAALATAAAVTVRQTSIWLIVPLVWEAWTSPRAQRVHRLAWGLSPLVPLGILTTAWHGLVPPVWHERQIAEGGISATPVIYLLTVLFTLGLPFYLTASDADDWRDAIRQRWIWALAAGTFGLVLAVPTLRDYASGRWGGYWWNLSTRLPTMGHVSTVFLLMAPLGAGLAGALVRRLWLAADRQAAWLWLAALSTWTATTLVNRAVFHRYYEPPLLVFLICWIALLARDQTRSPLAHKWPQIALGLAQLALTFLTVHAQAAGLIRFE